LSSCSTDLTCFAVQACSAALTSAADLAYSTAQACSIGPASVAVPACSTAQACSIGPACSAGPVSAASSACSSASSSLEAFQYSYCDAQSLDLGTGSLRVRADGAYAMAVVAAVATAATGSG